MKQYSFLVIATVICARTDGRTISCYFPSWSVYRDSPWNYSFDKIPNNTCDILIYSFVGIENNTWKIQVLDDYADVQLGGFNNAVSVRSRSPSTKVLFAVGGYAEGVEKFSKMVSTAARRKTFIDSAVEFIRMYGFDGMDLDWEFPGDVDRGGKVADKDNFSKLVKELSDVFQPNNWLLTAALTTFRDTVISAYDVPEISKYMDKMHIMTYDMRGPWTNNADNHAPLFRRPFDSGSLLEMNVADTMKLFADLGAPTEKLIVGIPFFGRSFTLEDPDKNTPDSPETGVGMEGDFTKTPGELAYFEICDLLANENWIQGFDSVGKVPYAYKGDQWVGYDDPSSIKTKVEWLIEQNYGGAMMWSIDQDDFLGSCGVVHPLLKAIKQNL